MRPRIRWKRAWARFLTSDHYLLARARRLLFFWLVTLTSAIFCGGIALTGVAVGLRGWRLLGYWVLILFIVLTIFYVAITPRRRK
jgi:hypothetical protein